MSLPLNIIIVERTGTLKSLAIKDFKLEDFASGKLLGKGYI